MRDCAVPFCGSVSGVAVTVSEMALVDGPVGDGESA
jgi:hypothetical protein